MAMEQVLDIPKRQVLELDLIPAPRLPFSPRLQIYADGSTGLLACVDSNGNNAFPPASLSPGSVVDGGTY